MAEEPEDAGRVTVEDDVIEPEPLSRQTVGVRMTLHHGAVTYGKTAFAAFKIHDPDTVGIGICGLQILTQYRIGITVTAPG